jgi:ELWxxDGT repeat protein
MLAVGNRLFFAASDGLQGLEPWVSDGTPGGTLLLQDIAPGVQSSVPTYPTVAGSKIFFIAYQPETGRELWALPRAALATPAEGVRNLLAHVRSLGLDRGMENNLASKLDQALRVLEDGDPGNDAKAAKSLEGFIQQVKIHRGKKIPPAQADALIAEAGEIVAGISLARSLET